MHLEQLGRPVNW